MDEYSAEFSPRSSLAVIGQTMQRMGIWRTVEKEVQIKQKVVVYRPADKMKDELMNILAGGQGTVEINTRVKPDVALQQAFGRQGCAEQSTVSDTFSACTEENVLQMRKALQQIYRQQGQGYRHRYLRAYQLLDVDLTGMPGGRQGEGVTKAVMADRRKKRGRQLGRVVATRYDEIVAERLYAGNKQLSHALQELVQDAEAVLHLRRRWRQRTIVRVDGGGGRDADLNWLLARGYGVVTKVKNWQRTQKLAHSVTDWYEDASIPGRQVGWVRAPHEYVRPTRQLAMRKRKPDGTLYLRILVTNLDDATLFELAGREQPKRAGQLDLLLALMQAYDKRGGAAETSIKGSKQGLGLTHRYKRNFHGQEMLVLLAQLAANLIIWVRNRLAERDPFWQKYGHLRMVRDVFHIPGRISFDRHGNLHIALNPQHCLSVRFTRALGRLLSINSPPLSGQN